MNREKNPNDRGAALITGSGKRIGQALALALADLGYDIAVHCNTSLNEANNTVARIRAKGRRAVVLQADLSSTSDAEALIPRASEALRPLSLLINSAASFSFDTVTNFTPEAWDQQMAINLRAPAQLSRSFATQLPEFTKGSIINILDQKLANMSPEHFSYSISKAGLGAMTELLARAYAPRIRVNGIAPGLTLPSSGQSQGRFDEIHNRTPLGIGSSPEDLVQAAIYLLDAPAVTGQIMYVDGGERFVRGRFDPSA